LASAAALHEAITFQHSADPHMDVLLLEMKDLEVGCPCGNLQGTDAKANLSNSAALYFFRSCGALGFRDLQVNSEFSDAVGFRLCS
jgi:hypothetical protein